MHYSNACKRALGLWLCAGGLIAGTACSGGDGTSNMDGDGGDSAGEAGSSGGGPGEDGGTSGGDGDQSEGGASNGDGGGASGDGGGSGNDGDADGCASDCDDGIDCTADECVDGTCVNRVDDGACGEGESCDLEGGGCVAGSACGDESDCDFPACSQNRACDPALAACVFDALDGDGDGFAPAVCGGGDCNDDDPGIAPGVTERCNGRDDDCDGDADDDAVCPGEGQVCVNAGAEEATCACPEEATECSVFGVPVCADTQTDPNHCGECGNPCGSAGTCTDGACSCSDPGVECTVQLGGGPGGGDTLELCVDTQTDASHCGDCNESCAPFGLGLCEDGECVACGEEGERCCPNLTGCDLDLICDGDLGAADSECVPCGQEVGQPCCSYTLRGTTYDVCDGDFGSGRPGGGNAPVCGDSGTCVEP